jgi:hypothetical protein
MSDTRMDFASAPARSLWGVIARRRGDNELLTRDIAANKAAEAMGKAAIGGQAAHARRGARDGQRAQFLEAGA